MRFIVVVLSILVSGCAGTPKTITQAELRHTDLVEIEVDPILQQRATYLGRMLLSSGERQEFLKDLTDNKYVKDSLTMQGVHNYNLFSAVGEQPGMDIAKAQIAVGLFNTFSKVGQVKNTTGIALPEFFNGEPVLDENDAWQKAVTYTEQKMSAAASAMGYSFECIKGCDAEMRSYLLKANGSVEHDHYIVRPDKLLAINAAFRPLVRIEDDPLRNFAHGFDVVWATDKTNSWMIDIRSDLYMPDGEITFYESSDDLADLDNWVVSQLQLDYFSAGREMLAKIYDNSYMYKGKGKRAYMDFFAYEGKVYNTRMIAGSLGLLYKEFRVRELEDLELRDLPLHAYSE